MFGKAGYSGALGYLRGWQWIGTDPNRPLNGGIFGIEANDSGRRRINPAHA